jgi:lysophospholipase L1-like esterase
MPLAFSLFLLLGLVPPTPAEPLRLADGDRVVLLGNTLIEREQRYGYWEAALVSRFPDRSIVYRNLGWSGDTVWGEARAGFGGPDDGFRRLQQQVREARPTVLLVAYGGNEAFAGATGLPRFRQGLDRLLDALAATKARIVLLAPLRHEDLGRPLPDPMEHNRDVQLYRDVLREAAEKRGYLFVDLFNLVEDGSGSIPPAPLTDNGIHLTAYGYWRSAAALERGLGFAPQRWHVELGANARVERIVGTKLAQVATEPLRFLATDTVLPPCAPPAEAPTEARTLDERILQIRGLAPGKHVLTIDGRRIVAATAAAWAAGVPLRRGPEFDQGERLRQAIVAKNELYFHRWRPQNETYLFGFRKAEQGQNAREIPQFDPLVARADARIALRNLPVAHHYVIVPSGD